MVLVESERTPSDMTRPCAQGGLARHWPWLVLAICTLPSIWYVVDFEDDVDPEFPTVVRPTFSKFPAPAYRFADAGDTIDHVAVYVASASIVLAGWGLYRSRGKRLWVAALVLSVAGFWHAATPGPLMDGWHGLGWRVIADSSAPLSVRVLLAATGGAFAATVVWCLWNAGTAKAWTTAQEKGIVGLLLASLLLIIVRQFGWLDHEPFGFWPRWVYVWGLLAWALALLRVAPKASSTWPRGAVMTVLVILWLGLDFTGRGLFWYQRPLHRLREVVPGRLYICAMPTYRGLELAQERHHFKTIINLYPEYGPTRSPLLPEELRFADEHAISYVGNPPGDPSGEAFVSQTLELARDPSTWPILVHCHASMDRSPAWVGLYRFVIQGWSLADTLRELEHHRGLRPKASVTLLYNRMLPQLAPERSALDPTARMLRDLAGATDDPVARIAIGHSATLEPSFGHRLGRSD
jgi:hypothetical protein